MGRVGSGWSAVKGVRVPSISSGVGSFGRRGWASVPGKKRGLARISEMVGATRLVELLPKRPALLILNYHRIGNAKSTPYDSGVFSCTAAEFEMHVRYLRTQFDVMGLQDAAEVLLGRRDLKRPSLLLTFDDGYRDNYDLAFPILQEHGVPAAFFLPTSFIGTSEVPWWDVIAYLVKRSERRSIELEWPERRVFDFSERQRLRSIAAILEIFKGPSMTDAERFLSGLEAACGVSRPKVGEVGEQARTFLSWDEAREMQGAGMRFGSHSHTHRIVSKLPIEQQREELALSREILERELGSTIDTFAYPVGGRDSFNEDTERSLAETGYRCAFTFLKGVNVPGKVLPYSVLRTGVYSGSASMLRLRSSLHALVGR